MQRNRNLFWIILLAISTLFSACEAPKNAKLIKRIPWMGKGHWLKVDTHVHTKFTDGKHPVEVVVAKAAEFGCQAIAITDHGDKGDDGATPEYFAAIEAARQTYPDMLILPGMEWNIPPYGGDEHATILLNPSPEAGAILADFKEQFDDYKRETHTEALAKQALQWLAGKKEALGARPIVIYNHPSRKRANTDAVVKDLKFWSGINEMLIGFSGAPGHQREGKYPIGSYRYDLETIDRWDPTVANIGDAWDVLLQSGVDLWAARASSDFHTENPKSLYDFWPGEFSETWVYVPDKSEKGVLRALRSGAFFAAHGHIVRELIFTVSGAEMKRPAFTGETMAASEGMELIVELNYTLPATDWADQENKIDEIELIGISANGAKSLFKQAPAAGRVEFSEKITVPEGGIVLRARGRRILDDQPDLLFYTNPIRVIPYDD